MLYGGGRGFVGATAATKRRPPINNIASPPFVERTGIEYTVLIDDMDNQAWKTFGGGPDLALLVERNGKVVAKQGWLDTIRDEINKLTAP